MKNIILLVFSLLSLSGYTQQDMHLSAKAQISILTCAPGIHDLHAYFGHTAIRVKDPERNLDQIYNYGTFDFKTPNFYLKFCRGQLLYQVISYPYKYFPYEYYKENRWVKSQVLNLTAAENQKLYDFLEWNILPENKKYRYDFFYDNCSTKMHEIIEQCIAPIKFDYSDFPKNLTHRNLIHQYLPKNSWTLFGIDLALGAVIDKKADNKAYMFLPDFTWLGFQKSSLQGKKLVKENLDILPDYHLKIHSTPFLLSPIFTCIVIFCICILLLLFPLKATNVLSNILMSFVGISGVVIVLLWFFTEHSTTKMNFNILWANPILLSIVFTKNLLKKGMLYSYFFCLLVFVVLGIFNVQEFNICFYIIASAMALLSIKKLLTFKIQNRVDGF